MNRSNCGLNIENRILIRDNLITLYYNNLAYRWLDCFFNLFFFFLSYYYVITLTIFISNIQVNFSFIHESIAEMSLFSISRVVKLCV